MGGIDQVESNYGEFEIDQNKYQTNAEASPTIHLWRQLGNTVTSL